MERGYTVSHYPAGDLRYLAGGYKSANLHRWGPGVREVYALHYIISGRGTLETGGVKYHIREGESFLIFPHMEVYYYPDPEQPWEYVWNEFSGEEARQLLAMTKLEKSCPAVGAAPGELRSLFQIAWNPGVQPYERLRSDARLRLLLSCYLEFYPCEEAAPTDYAGMAKAYIEHNYWKPSLRVSDIVQAVNIERSYLFRLFKEATGQSVSGYITWFRIRRARELLKSSGLSVQSVAYSIGYHDPLHFSRVFKKATSYSPTAFRLMHRQES
jgi:AraC-like DNA-binding protein